MEPETLVSAFNDAITRQDLASLGALMTDDHTFTDSAGTRIVGKPACLDAWAGFFAAFPGYKNRFESLKTDGATVVIAGQSRSDDPRLDGPALWCARVADGKLAAWEVFDDTPETRAALGLVSG